MSSLVREIMNRELFWVRPEDSVASARNGILALGITAAPVLDPGRHPLGIVSLRDLTDGPGTEPALERMTSPAVSVAQDDPVEFAAGKLAQTRLRHLLVIDHGGLAVGMVSAGDVLRSLMGLPPAHPPAFPSPELSTEPLFGEPWPLDLDAVLDHAPAGPGVFQLALGDDDGKSAVIWAESCDNVRSRMMNLLSLPLENAPALRSWIDRELLKLRFRVAEIDDPARRDEVVRALADRSPRH